MKEYGTYIFDLDGTITQSMDVWMDVFRSSVLHFGLDLEDEVLIKHAHDWSTLTEVGLDEKRLPEFTQHIHGIATVKLESTKFFEDSLDVLQKLKDKGKNLAIFSSMDRPLFDVAIQQGDLYSIVPVAVAGTDVPFRKPHPAGILKAMDDLGLSESDRRDAAYMGDRHTDIQAAVSAGIDSILFYPTEHAKLYKLEELQKYKPTHTIRDWRSLIVT